MVDRLGILVVLVGIAVVGNLRLRRGMVRLLDQKDRIIEFNRKLAEYVQGGGRDAGIYQWLTFHSVKIQNDLGPHGYVTHFRPPFANYVVPYWAIVLNALPEIQRGFTGSFLFEQAQGYTQILSDALLRFGGVLEDRIEAAQAEVRNPVSSFREGVAVILRLPLDILHWLGLKQKPVSAGGAVSRTLSGAISLLALLSAVVSLIAGWEPTTQFVTRLWERMIP
jgi:hypothetical protein